MSDPTSEDCRMNEDNHANGSSTPSEGGQVGGKDPQAEVEGQKTSVLFGGRNTGAGCLVWEAAAGRKAHHKNGTRTESSFFDKTSLLVQIISSKDL